MEGLGEVPGSRGADNRTEAAPLIAVERRAGHDERNHLMSHRAVQVGATIGFWFCVAMAAVNLAFFVAFLNPASAVGTVICGGSAALVWHSRASIRRSHESIERSLAHIREMDARWPS
jgi:hypothetical protein